MEQRLLPERVVCTSLHSNSSTCEGERERERIEWAVETIFHNNYHNKLHVREHRSTVGRMLG